MIGQLRRKLTDVFYHPSAVIFVLLATVYLATLTQDYYWDGVTFALQIEKVEAGERGASLLFHQNHLLYNALGYLLYKASQGLGLGLRALTILQLANALIGAAAVAIFYRLAERITGNRYAALGCSAALAFSAVWWRLATDADAYILSVFFLLISANNLLGEKPRWWMSGAALAFAMLIHQLAALFFPAACAAVWLSQKIERRLRFSFAMSAVAWGVTVTVYYICAAMRNITDPVGVIRWAASNQSGVSPSFDPLPGLAFMPRANVELFIGHSFALFRREGGALEWLFAILALIALVISITLFARRMKERRLREVFRGIRGIAEMPQSRIVIMIAIWTGAYLVFLIFWEPWMIYYRVFYAPAIALLFGLVLASLYASGIRLSGAAVMAVIAMAFFNLAFYITPHTRANANPLVAAARDARNVWSEGTLIYFAKPNQADVRFEYFNQQTRWKRLSPAVMSELDAEIERGKSIWINKGAAESVEAEWLDSRATGRELGAEAPNAPARYVEIGPAR